MEIEVLSKLRGKNENGGIDMVKREYKVYELIAALNDVYENELSDGILRDAVGYATTCLLRQIENHPSTLNNIVTVEV